MITTRQIAAAAHLPLETARRYLRTFPEYCPGTREGRRTLYDDDVVRVVQEIRTLYDQGLGTEEIRATLSHHHPPTIEAVEVTPPDALPPEVIRVLALLPGIVEQQQERIATLEGEVKRADLLRLQQAEKSAEMETAIQRMQAEIEAIRTDREKGYGSGLRHFFGIPSPHHLPDAPEDNEQHNHHNNVVRHQLRHRPGGVRDGRHRHRCTNQREQPGKVLSLHCIS